MLLAAVIAVAWLLILPEPGQVSAPAEEPAASVVPTWLGPAPMTVPGTLIDGSQYQPRIFLAPDTSVGLAMRTDGALTGLVMRGPDGAVTQLRAAAGEQALFDGFAVSGDVLVWAESISYPDAPVSTTLWQANWRAGSPPSVITTDTGEAQFAGGQYDIVIQDGRVYWMALVAGDPPVTELRSVALAGVRVDARRLDQEFALSAWPWVVSVGGGRGTPIDVVNLTTGERVVVATQTLELAACSAVWCRIGVLGQNRLVRIDLQRPDGSQRRRVAGSDATPTIADVTLLDRFVPLATDRGDGLAASTGLSLYDIDQDRIDLLAVGVANIQGRDGVLWWSTGIGDDLEWHALDLRTLG